MIGAALGVTAASLVAGLAANAGGADWAVALRPWLDADDNGRLPVAFEALCLFGAGLACVLVWHDGKGTAGTRSGHWAGLAVLFALLGAEKAVGLHELAAAAVSAQYGTFRGGLMGTFVIPAVAVLALLAWAYREFVKSLPAATIRGLAWGWALLLGCGIGLELVAAVWIKMTGGGDAIQVLLANAEEAGEMIGAAILFRVLWRHARGAPIPPS